MSKKNKNLSVVSPDAEVKMPETRDIELTPVQLNMVQEAQDQLNQANRIMNLVMAGVFAAAGLQSGRPVNLEGNTLTVALD